jgi:hypothetical protein
MIQQILDCEVRGVVRRRTSHVGVESTSSVFVMDRGRLLSLRIISESLLCAEWIICAYMIPRYGCNIWRERKFFSIEG